MGKHAIVTLAIGDYSQKLLQVAKPYFELYAQKCNAELIIITDKKINVWANNLEKFQIYHLHEKYSRIIYLDVDILVHPDCPDLFKIVPENEIGAVYDNQDNSKFARNRVVEIKKAQTCLGRIPGWETEYINSGVIVTSYCHRKIYSNPELRLKLNSSYKDQTLINYNIQKNKYPIYKLNVVFNGMEITGFSSRNHNPKHPNVNNKTDAWIMHFANEGDKYTQMQFVSNQLVDEFKLPFKKWNYDKTKLNLRHNTQDIINPKSSPNSTHNIQTKQQVQQARTSTRVKKHHAVEIPRNPLNQKKNNKNTGEITIVDFAELGWSMYNAGHAKWLVRKQNRKVNVILRDPGREVLYRDVVNKFYSMPEEWMRTYGHLPSDGNHLFDPRTNKRIKDWNALLYPIKKKYPNLNILERYTKFENQRIMEPYQHSKEAEDLYYKETDGKPSVIIFPRFRTSKFAIRNLEPSKWIHIINTLCVTFKDLKIVAFGTKDGAININNIKHKNFVNLIGYNDNKTLDMMIAAFNIRMCKCSIGNQSAPPKISLLCRCPAYMFGHERRRHQLEENWSKTPCQFWEARLSNNGYHIPNFDLMVEDILKFVEHHSKT